MLDFMIANLLWLHKMQKNTPLLLVWVFILSAFVISFFSTQISLPLLYGSWFATHIQLAVILFHVVLQLGAAVIFLLGLKNFKKELKHAYLILCAGLIILGLFRLQLIVLQIFNLWSGPWVSYGVIELLFSIGQLCILLGIRSLALLLHVKTVLTSKVCLFISLVIISAIMCIVPHSSHALADSSLFFFTIFSVFNIWQIVFLMFSIFLVLKIKQNTSFSYANSFAWLFLALVLNTISVAQISYFHLLGFSTAIWMTKGFFNIPYILTGIAYLLAGYSFNKIKIY